MFYILLFLLIFYLGKIIWDKAGNLIKILASIFAVLFIISLIVSNFGLILKLVIGLIIICAVGAFIERNKVTAWLEEESPEISIYELEDKLKQLSNTILQHDNNNTDYKFDIYRIPYGRVNAFLNYFGKNIDEEEVYYYSAIRSSKRDELREYGLAVTQSGLYISEENSIESSDSRDTYIPFSGIHSATVTKKGLKVSYVDKEKMSLNDKDIVSSHTVLSSSFIKSVIDTAISHKINHALYKNTIIDSTSNKDDKVKNAEDQFNISQRTHVLKKAAEVGGIVGSHSAFNKEFSDLKNYMNGDKGHGYGAEYANNTFDKLAGRKVINEAQNLENGRQVKYGADRIVDGDIIQTKYYNTAENTINSVFKNKQAVYLNPDGTMMQIEVPRDQYSKAVELMQQRIDSGQVPNVKPGEDARNYVRKGYYTYSQSFNVCKAGTIESLTVDLVDGAICSSVAGGISATIVFAMALWSGQDIEDAAKAGLSTGINVLGRGALIYTLTMQLSRSEIAIPFMKEVSKQGSLGVSNPTFLISEQIAGVISNSNIATSAIGSKLGLANVTGKQVIASGITGMIVFGPDICKVLSGRISTKQLFKNSAIGASGLGGSIIGQALIPIPGLGAIAGGMISSFVAKKVLDGFIEDDAHEMFQILKEEFLDIVMLSNLNEDEFNKVLNLTLCNSKLSKVLEDMYASQEYRRFAREAVISAAVIDVLSMRDTVFEDSYDKGYSLLLQTC